MLLIITISLSTLLVVIHAIKRPKVRKARVTSVTDGDTITVSRHDGKEIIIRLYGIDAPESEQRYGDVASAVLNGKIYGKEISYIKKGKDKYGRTIARVFLNGQDISLWMLQEGHAWFLEDFCRYKDYFQAEKTARRSHKGLWKDLNPIKPIYYRNQINGSI